MCLLVAEHTSNEWVVLEDGTETISNLVYKFTCRYHILPPEYAGRRGPHQVNWKLTTNAAVRRLAVYRAPIYENAVLCDRRRCFKSEQAARYFLETIKKEYAPYFTQLCPPIPQDCVGYFEAR